MELLKMYINFETLLGCLLIGNVIKHSLPKINNQLIPIIIIGAGIACEVSTKGFTTQAILTGAFTGLMAVGGHQAFKQTLKQLDDFKGSAVDGSKR